MDSQSTESPVESPAEASPPEVRPTGKGPMGRKGAMPSLWSMWHTTRTARMARITTFVAVLLAGGSWLAFERTEAQLGDDLLGMGTSLMEFADPVHTTGPRALSINGEVVHLISGSTPESLDTVLSSFEEVCLQNDGQFRAQIEEFYREHPDADHRETLSRFRPSVRREGEGADGSHRGTVGCLDLGTERRTAGEILDAAREFNETGDLSRLGNIRYIFAQDADAGRTHYVALWTEGEFHIRNILPGNSDGPGEDVEGIPRAPDSRRSLSAFEVGRDERFVMYEGSSMTEWELEHFYRTSLAADGWSVMDTEQEGAPSQLVAAMRDGRQVYISLNTDPHGRGTAMVALTE
jgi:hypothetical protein